MNRDNKYLSVIGVRKIDVAGMKDVVVVKFDSMYFQKNDNIISADEDCNIKVGFRTSENEFSYFEIEGEVKVGQMFCLNFEKNIAQVLK
jgi:hypothetical protein